MDYTDLYIDGEWRKGADRFDVINPATEEVLASVASADVADADAALDAAEGRHGRLGRAQAARTLRGAAQARGS
jgi:acyl-CoA reductase-like NAD-dependent aldehyde dehydrogenase